MFAGHLRNILQRRTGSLWLRCLLGATAALLLSGIADARNGTIALKIIGDERMADELKKLTEDLDKDEPLSGDSLSLLQAAQVRRARIATALRSRGYYDARVTATVDNQSIEDPAALDAIDRQPESAKVTFDINVATGPVYRVADLGIEGPPEVVGYPGLDRSKLTLKPGQPA